VLGLPPETATVFGEINIVGAFRNGSDNDLDLAPISAAGADLSQRHY
jgi:hypothetical protein